MIIHPNRFGQGSRTQTFSSSVSWIGDMYGLIGSGMLSAGAIVPKAQSSSRTAMLRTSAWSTSGFHARAGSQSSKTGHGPEGGGSPLSPLDYLI